MSQSIRGVDTRWQPRSTDTGGVPTGPRTGLTTAGHRCRAARRRPAPVVLSTSQRCDDRRTRADTAVSLHQRRPTSPDPTRRMVPMISRHTTTLNTLNDDHGDQLPGALPASSAPAGADEP